MQRQNVPDFELHHGDCLEVMPQLAPDSVAMVFADLPYNVAKHLHWDKRPFDVARFDAAVRVPMMPGAACVMMGNMRFCSIILGLMKIPFRYDLVWHKQCPSNFYAAKRQPLSYHEHVLIFADGKTKYNPQMIPESERGQVLSRVRTLKAMDKKFFGASKEGKALVAGPMYPRSVLLKIKRDAQRKTMHPTQKPLALLEWLIATYTNPGDTVLDPTFGSGVSGVACANLGRRFIGIEKDATYFAAAKARIEAAYATAGTKPAQGALAV